MRKNVKRSKVVLGAVPDLFLWSKVAGAATRLGIEARQAASADALRAGLEAGADLVLVDLDAQGLDAMAAVRQTLAGASRGRPRLVAFASHVHGPLLQQAKAAGCDSVLTRGAMVSSLSRLLASA